MSFAEQPLNMMEVITPENGLPVFGGELTSESNNDMQILQLAPDPTSSSLEYLSPDSGKILNDGINLDNTGTSPDGAGTSPDGAGTSPDGAGTSPDGAGASSQPSLLSNIDLYDRVKVLADTVEKEINILKHDKGNTSVTPPLPRHGNHKDSDCTTHDDSTCSNKSGEEEGDEMKQKIQRALSKMKKLDSKLAQVIKKEKEVKLRRSQPIDTAHIINKGGDISLETSQLVFRTQPLEGGSHDISVECLETGSDTSETDSDSTENRNESVTSKTQHAKSFIQRNKELAGEKGDVLMTEEERKRLEELLNEEEEATGVQVASTSTTSGCGYCYTDEEQCRLDQINRTLETIIPSLTVSKSASLLTGCGLGEEILSSLQCDRSEHVRLKEINDCLKILKELHDSCNDKCTIIADDSGCLTEEQLIVLLEQYHIEQQLS